MFANRRFSDVVGMPNIGLASCTLSASTASSSGLLVDLSTFQKYAFRLYSTGGFIGNPLLYIYSCSTSASSISSASSNWAIVDSTNLVLNCASSLGSVSSTAVAATLELRAEKLFSGTSPIRYIRPVITMGSTASSGASSFNGCVTAFGMVPDYGPANANFTTYNVLETDYL